jgi:predicted ester cyclase
MNSTEDNMKTVRTFTRVFKNEHNVDGIDHLFAKDFKHNFAPPLRPGLAGFKDIGRMMNHAFPDVVVTEHDLIANENTVVERSSASATHKGDFMGTPPTGRKIHWTEIHIYRLVDGRIAEHWVELSMLQLLQQIGAIPPPQAA